MGSAFTTRRDPVTGLVIGMQTINLLNEELDYDTPVEDSW